LDLAPVEEDARVRYEGGLVSTEILWSSENRIHTAFPIKSRY